MQTLTQKSHRPTTSLLYLVSFHCDISVSINVATKSFYLDSYPENSLWGQKSTWVISISPGTDHSE